jgi:transposase
MDDDFDVDLRGMTDDPETLKKMLVMVWKRMRQLEARVAAAEAESHRAPKRSQQHDEHQRYLFDELLARDAAAEERTEDDEDPDPDPPGGGGQPRRRGKRAPLPADLPREVERHELPEDDPERACSCCNAIMQEVGVRTTEQLDYRPARLVVRQHQQVVYGCRTNKCDASIARASKPPQPIERGMAGPGLLAHVIVSRFDDHLPYYRQAQMFARQGVSVSQRSMSRWMYYAADLLKPIVDHMAEAIKKSRRIHGDDATLPVLQPGHGRVWPAKIWTWVGDESQPHTVYRVTERRTKEEPGDFLAGFEGALQADAASVFDHLFKISKIIEIACWSHAKRKLDEVLEQHDLRAGEVLALIGEMYEVEAEGRELGEKARKELRQRRVKPILARIRARCDELGMIVRPKSSLAAALTYINNQWAALCRFANTGHLEPDNNIAERALRGVCIGRKNWLFAGSFESADKAAVLLSLVESCERNRINTFDYLRDVLQRISIHPSSRIAELTPAGWKAAREAEADAA